MITTITEMKQIEQNSQLSTRKLMKNAGTALSAWIRKDLPKGSRVCILAGHGNNGGDGFVIAQNLKEDYQVSLYLVDGEPQTKDACFYYKALPHSMFLTKRNWKKRIQQQDLIIDAVYGFGYHGSLTKTVSETFSYINSLSLNVYSIDINSGCEADTGYCDPNALHSKVTYALDCYKAFHLLKKEHQLFKQCILVDLKLPHPSTSSFYEMDEETFFASLPKKTITSYKGSYGKTLLIGGSYGMAGALSLNIIGAKTIGAPYINVCLPDEIYNVVASHHITPVYHPFGNDNFRALLEPLAQEAKVIAFGSGAGVMNRKSDILDLILQFANGPIVLDAEAIRLLDHNTWILRFVTQPVILTPHIGEFADLLHISIQEVTEHRIKYAHQFAVQNKVTVVLKGYNTVVAFPDGKYYVNQSGCQALAQAGSGDLLTGILAGVLTYVTNVPQAVCMAVWLHGYLSEYGHKEFAYQNFPLEQYPGIMNQLYQSHGY